MPGTNHDVEAGFMDNLPFSLRDAALDILNYSTLNEMLDIRLNGPNAYLKKVYSHTQEEWHIITRAAILTKLSYFTPNILYPDKHLDRLIQIAKATYGSGKQDLIDLYRATQTDYPFFAQWLKSIIETQQKKHRLKLANQHRNT